MELNTTTKSNSKPTFFLKSENQVSLCNLVIDTISDAILLLNKDFEIIYQNSAVERITGFSFKETMGISALNFVYADDAYKVAAFLKDVAANPNVCMHTEIRAVHKNGSSLWVEGSITNMINDPHLEAYVVNYRDVTERKNSEAALKDINSHLEDMVKERTSDLDAFTHSVSHDLRAPVRAINGLAQMLSRTAKDSLSETSNRIITEISNETKHMNELIDDLMRLCQSGSKPPVLKETDMNQLVQIALRELVMGVENTAEITVHSMPKVKCDAGLILQVWSNLLSNALKYSAKNTNPVIEIGCKEGGVFYVKDNGAGFDMKYAPKLFNVFQRLHTRSDFEGTGVGLSLVKRVIDKHYGEIWVEAAVGKGATFYFTLNTHLIKGADPLPGAPPFPVS